MKTHSSILSTLLAPLRLAFSLGLAAWWASGWVFFSLWHFILFLVLPDRLDVPEQFLRQARRRAHEQVDVLRWVWDMKEMSQPENAISP